MWSITEDAEMRLGDCLEHMAEIPDGSIDLIFTDPPYGTVKGLDLRKNGTGAYDWDDIIDHGAMVSQCERVLRMNGAKLLFCQDPYTLKLATEYAPGVPFAYRITWDKQAFANPLAAKKAPVNYTEDICVFFKKCPKHDHEAVHPLRPYAEYMAQWVGKEKEELFRDMGHQGACHWMRFGSSQFSRYSERTHDAYVNLYGVDKMPGYIPFEHILEIDNQYKAENAAKWPDRAFNLPEGRKHMPNLLSFKRPSRPVHPTQKPVELLEYLIKAYTNPGDTVLDFTAGSGSTGVACRNTGRKFIGIERDPEYYGIAVGRIVDATT